MISRRLIIVRAPPLKIRRIDPLQSYRIRDTGTRRGERFSNFPYTRLMVNGARIALLPGLIAAVCWQSSFAQISTDSVVPTDDQLEQIGLEYQDAMNAGDVDWAVSLFDMEAFGMRMAEPLYTNPSDRSEFALGLVEGGALANLIQRQIGAIESSFGYASYLRVHAIEDMRGPLVRLDLGENGFEYFLLVVEQRGVSPPKIADLFVGTNGERLSTSAGAIAQLMLEPSESLLGRLFGQSVANEELLDLFRALVLNLRTEDYAAAYEVIETMPAVLRNHRILAGIAVQVAGRLDEQVYQEELRRLAEFYGDDPRTAFLLVDYYFLQGDFGSAMQQVENLEQIFGLDGAIALLKTTISIELGDADAALAYAEAGEAAEPLGENSQLALLNAYLMTDRYEGVVATINALEALYGYFFNDEIFASDPVYADFSRSPEFEAWSAGRESPVRE